MQFRPLAIRTIVSLMAGGIVGVALTLLNYGVWALIWQVITQKGLAAVMPTLFHTWLDSRWYPGVVPAQLLVLTCVPYVTIYTVGALLMAQNQQRTEAWLEATQTGGAILAVCIAAPFGLMASAASIAARPFVLLALPLMAARVRGKYIATEKPRGSTRKVREP